MLRENGRLEEAKKLVQQRGITKEQLQQYDTDKTVARLMS